MRWAYGAGAGFIAAVMASDLWLPIDYRVAANTALLVTATLTTVFVLLYGIRSNWRANDVGKTLFRKSIVLPIVLWQIVLSVWVDEDYPFRQQIRFIIYTLGAAAYVTMVVMLWREQQHDRHDPHE